MEKLAVIKPTATRGCNGINLKAPCPSTSPTQATLDSRGNGTSFLKAFWMLCWWIVGTLHFAVGIFFSRFIFSGSSAVFLCCKSLLWVEQQSQAPAEMHCHTRSLKHCTCVYRRAFPRIALKVAFWKLCRATGNRDKIRLRGDSLLREALGT